MTPFESLPDNLSLPIAPTTAIERMARSQTGFIRKNPEPSIAPFNLHSRCLFHEGHPQ
ncbi:hypothetical protein HCG48_04020 [Oxynema aestuarii AP17]|uniref:Uncharacterized protein n=1 Tax=Oxynema aestuarii AP17 TaxID=2064643 RepID=A0A6H1TWY1_9CYAN|nr:hypothetical protein HCG48_04020 [Oxynema aestuarii AP17]